MKKYKQIISLLVVSLIAVVNVSAQLDRSIRPEPGPAPEIKIGEHHSFTLDNGLKVIVVENHKIPVVSYQLTVDVDPVMENDAVGYVSFTGDLLRSGTSKRSKAEIDEQIDFIGANLNTYTNGIYAQSLKKHTETLLEIMSDVLLNPVFPESELEKSKKQNISGLKASETDPNAISSRVAQKLRFPNHPYGEIETEETIEKITREKCLDYYNTYYKPNVSYLVVIGDITVKETKKIAEKYFGQWKKAEVPTHEYQFPNKTIGTRIAMVHKDDAVQSVISVTYPVNLKPGSADAIAANLTNEILGGGVFSGRLMLNLREDKGYTYGARSSLRTDPYIGYFQAGAQVGTNVTDSAVVEFIYEMNRIRNEKVSNDDISLTKNVSTGSFARSLERPQTIARFALNTQRYGLSEDYYKTYLEKLNAVSIDEIQQMAKKYITPDHAIVLVVGDKNKLADRLKALDADGKIEFYDSNGNPVKEETKKSIPEGVTAQTVIDNYIEAIGGKENLENIQDITIEASTNMNGMEIKQKTYKKAPNKFAMIMSMNGSVIMQQVYNGERAIVKSFQGEQELTGEDLENLKVEAALNAELKYDELGVNLTLESIEQVEGKDAYKIKVENPTGKTTYDFFDVESGLHILTKETIVAPQGEFTQMQAFLNYQEVDGVKFPFTIKISGVQNMELTVESVEMNTDLGDELF